MAKSSPLVPVAIGAGLLLLIWGAAPAKAAQPSQTTKPPAPPPSRQPPPPPAQHSPAPPPLRGISPGNANVAQGGVSPGSSGAIGSAISSTLDSILNQYNNMPSGPDVATPPDVIGTQPGNENVSQGV